VLYAHGRNRAPALAVSLGWVLVIVANAAIVPFVRPSAVVPALGAGTSLGLTVAGVVLLLQVRRVRGTGALAGLWRAFGAGLVGCVAGVAVGMMCSVLVSGVGFAANAGLSMLVSVLIAGVFAVIVMNLDGGDVRAALTRLRSRRVPAS
jgi:putative peptidoglycan lipid II flippase